MATKQYPAEAVSLFGDQTQHRTPIQRAISQNYLLDEESATRGLLEKLTLSAPQLAEIQKRAIGIVDGVRSRRDEQTALDAFMHEYDLSSEEGVLLMCLAEALLRIPDAETAERLIRDKLGAADWDSHLGKSSSLFVNASTWGLMLTGKVVTIGDATRRDFLGTLNRLIAGSGEPVIRLAVRQAMRVMGHQFVMGRDIKSALKRCRGKGRKAYRYSYDMLGEGALTADDAARYLGAYRDGIAAMGKQTQREDIFAAPSISVKLSALHPRYEFAKRERVLEELSPRLLELARLARSHSIALTVDAEEADRLELSLEVFEAVFRDPSLAGWSGLGLAVQTYLKRAPQVFEWLADLANNSGRMIPVRLVKGAYWDTEIKHAQELGLSDYPVYTRKATTDAAYLACAREALEHRDLFYPQFATHNAHTIAAISTLAGDCTGFEFQRLHGMGAQLYQEVMGEGKLNIPCRVYAPVGNHEDLLPYLVRRLLENGANSSFVNRIVDEKLPAAEVVADPIAITRRAAPKRNTQIPLPPDIYGSARKNAQGIHLTDWCAVERLQDQMRCSEPLIRTATPLIPGALCEGSQVPISNPANRKERLGSWQSATPHDVVLALQNAAAIQSSWDQTAVTERAAMLERAATLLEQRTGLFVRLIAEEAGRTIADGVSEVREAIDFCRYYACQARENLTEAQLMTGPTGEKSTLRLHGRGLFVCISPWNFPLAIFTGQVVAALVAGNAVIAKPAEQTNLIAFHAVKLMHEAGIPSAVLQFVPGHGHTVGTQLCSDGRVSGVAFTGGTDTARIINQTLAQRSGPLATLIAETGGLNTMIVDSSALPEQITRDVIQSAFGSAGQRCSALRILYVQEDIADRVLNMLAGAMMEIEVGDPRHLTTDVGPLIDEDAQRLLTAHIEKIGEQAKLIGRSQLPKNLVDGCFVAPHAFEISHIEELKREVFGPVLHVVRYHSDELPEVMEAINATGYGLTMGIHSRVESTCDTIASQAKVGNCYVNRNMVGAVVGVHPFGGEGLSGTGPKAGGPRYLYGFTTERTLTINTTAVGGNATLLSLDD